MQPVSAPRSRPTNAAADNTRGAETGCKAAVSAPRVLSAAALVGRLRGVVCAPDGAVDELDRR
ncbi:hypothetical protein MAHJHV35_48080 [Mycobacterium avium subsp. hominissuis]